MAQFSIQAIKQRFGIIGNSKDLERALETAVRVADTDLTVLITGESGTGKEIFSQIIHSLSKRKHNKFIAVNCGAIPPGQSILNYSVMRKAPLQAQPVSERVILKLLMEGPFSSMRSLKCRWILSPIYSESWKVANL